ncbi:hypothetical protein NAF17_05480 [Mucilaginibacter sp. RB4R14]|uniref:hypothetical protein n=1 Tax=Mucilaginibacter aurantiaciroseus TaxID=2949308 RepID=UPI0020914F3B|nr:hypothetical protein [Mucilaginibacter aurantiaciroseus]MCO5934981.1 hypothetical protein [Mucilaginibacter aurantiaciroseus]
MPDINPSFCQHLQAIKEVKLSDDHVCEECVKQGAKWFHLPNLRRYPVMRPKR